MSGAFPQGLPRLESAGLDGWVVRLFDAIDEGNMPWLTALVRECEVTFGDRLVDLVPSYTTLLVIFDPLRLSPGEARRWLLEILSGCSLTKRRQTPRSRYCRSGTTPRWGLNCRDLPNSPG